MEEKIKKISSKEFADFVLKFYKDKKYPNQRFGQAFLNTYFPLIVYSELFYQENWAIAWNLITRRFVDFEVKNEG